jgi:hypothetical protein
MKNPVLYFMAGIILTISISVLWAFTVKPAEEAKGYAVADFYYATTLLDKFKKINITYNDGTTEELKYDQAALAPDIIIMVSNKIEAKGYTLQQTDMTGVKDMLYNRLVFKKK